jgi:hypothetical protein
MKKLVLLVVLSVVFLFSFRVYLKMEGEETLEEKSSTFKVVCPLIVEKLNEETKELSSRIIELAKENPYSYGMRGPTESFMQYKPREDIFIDAVGDDKHSVQYKIIGGFSVGFEIITVYSEKDKRKYKYHYEKFPGVDFGTKEFVEKFTWIATFADDGKKEMAFFDEGADGQFDLVVFNYDRESESIDRVNLALIFEDKENFLNGESYTEEYFKKNNVSFVFIEDGYMKQVDFDDGIRKDSIINDGMEFLSRMLNYQFHYRTWLKNGVIDGEVQKRLYLIFKFLRNLGI